MNTKLLYLQAEGSRNRDFKAITFDVQDSDCVSSILS